MGCVGTVTMRNVKNIELEVERLNVNILNENVWTEQGMYGFGSCNKCEE